MSSYCFNAKKETENMIAYWKAYFAKTFSPETNAVVALSGGKDSSVVAALMVAALGKDRVKGIMLPQHVQDDIDCSIQLAEHLGIEYKIVNIGPTVDSIVEEMKKSGVEPTRQALLNVAARVRMVETFFYGQCVNGVPSCNCNLSEDWIGWATYGGDGFGCFAPLQHYTVTEVKQIGRELGVPENLVNKVPKDGLTDKTDEDNFGFTYAVLDHYIRTGEIEDLEIKKSIDSRHRANAFKLLPMVTYRPELPVEA